MKKIKKTLAVAIGLMLMLFAGAQENWPPLDNSPMDMIYLPVDYPILKIRKSAPETPVIKIIYSRPQKKKRTVFGELVDYGSVWRLGANEATELDLFKDVKIANTKIRKGRYTLYAIPYKEKWTIIINKENDVWGAFAYDEKKDILRTDVKTEKNAEPVESFTMMFEKTGTGANLLITWEDVKVSLPVTL
ncbi:DUF2911 domain-containing protein [Agriterribacter sp.]|uniref:DUF2911 domain-containing protein n=1 Tax=Agriterribacter sp. TaxID=2821509 RepID=UPI002B8480A7|nr:DUF2911 domain-containing protein [Agriterribacter sp.]HTN05201.1 DUF2911 domain-containing protein [Agriterribacter sp.]